MAGCFGGRGRARPLAASGFILGLLLVLSATTWISAAPWRYEGDTGPAVQVNYEPGSVFLVGDRTYELLQIHFHAPSEETIDGHRYPLVAHLVHSDKAGNLAVVAVLFDADESGSRGPHPGLAPIVAHLPQEAGPEQFHPDVIVQAMHLLPDDRCLYFFEGSLTTPPCTEGVAWFVFRTPVPIGKEQLARITTIYPNNARPIQPPFGRTVQASH